LKKKDEEKEKPTREKEEINEEKENREGDELSLSSQRTASTGTWMTERTSSGPISYDSWSKWHNFRRCDDFFGLR